MKKLFPIFLLICLQINLFAQNQKVTQTQTIGRDVVADAPWRMKKTDGKGNLNGIPVHVFIKDANLTQCNADLIYLNIYLKNAKDSLFGSPIVFNAYSDSTFAALFSSKSKADAALGIQSFDASLPVKDPNYTIQFKSDYSLILGDYTNVSHQFWYFTITIPPDKLAGLSDIVDIEVEFSLGYETDDYQYLRVFRNDNDFPKLPEWYRGDIHYHSFYTNNSAEFGLPLEATKQVAKAVGLDFMITSNHSCDYDNYGTSMQSNWKREDSEMQALNAVDTSMIFMHGMEASVKNSAGNVVHMLSYPNPASPHSIPYIGDGNGDLTMTSVTINDLLDSLNKYGGFSYAAHPFAGGDKLSATINGGIWNVNDASFLANGAAIAGHDVVICNNPSYPSDLYSTNSGELFKEGLKGCQIWNYRNAMATTDQKWNPWNDLYSSSITAFAPYDSLSTYFHYNRFLQGLEVSKFFLKKGLKMKNSNNSIQNYRLFMSAGSDAHGDFNFSNTNFVYGFTADISDAAIGKPSTVVYCPSGRGNEGTNVLSAYKNGHVIYSDGPLISMYISAHGNINNPDYIIGDEAIPTSTDYSDAKLKVDISSNYEFGKIRKIKFILGTQNGEHIVYLPVDSNSYNHTYIYNLDSLVQQSLSGDSIKDYDYFYIRAEVNTYKNYGSQFLIYRRAYENFNCYTNPIWIRKPLTITTAIHNISNSSVCKAFPNPFGNSVCIHLENISGSNIKVELFNLVGSLIQTKEFSNISNNENYFINTESLSEGLYLLKVSTNDKIFDFKLFKTTSGKAE